MRILGIRLSGVCCGVRCPLVRVMLNKHMIYAGESDILRLIWRRIQVKEANLDILSRLVLCAHGRQAGCYFLDSRRDRDKRESHMKKNGGGGFTVFCPSEEENKGPYTREGAQIRSAQVARASTMGLNFNKVKCRYAARLSLNEIALQAERVSSCCFWTALIM